MKRLNKNAAFIAAMNVFFIAVLISMVVTGNNWDAVGSKVLCAASIFLNILFTEYFIAAGGR